MRSQKQKLFIAKMPFVAALLLLAAVLQIDLYGMIKYGMAQSTNSSASDPKGKSVLDAEESGFLQKQFENAVTEIRFRLEHEHLLFGLKFTLVGAILAMLFTAFVAKRDISAGSTAERSLSSSPAIAAFCWAAVITSAIIDTRIRFNMDLISSLGDWIASEVEPRFLQCDTIGWERYLRTKSALFSSPVFSLLLMHAQLLTFVLFVAVVLLSVGQASDVQRAASHSFPRRICATGNTLCFIAFFFIAVHFHHSQQFWWVWCAIISMMGALTGLFVWRPWRGPDANCALGDQLRDR